MDSLFLAHLIATAWGKMSKKKIKGFCLLCFATITLSLIGERVVSGSDQSLRPVPPAPTDSFGPSNARTEHGGLIPVEQFFPASRCLGCHQDTHNGWSQSLHRNAAREPFYRESADLLLRTRGIEFTRHCESCHTPVALFSGALTNNAKKKEAPFTSLDHEGVTCTVCHSITEARLDGTGSYTIRRPALLASEDGAPRYGDFRDDEILADVPGHKRAVMRPLLKSPEFCATCHKVDAPPSLNRYKHIRGFSAYDEWQQSGASHETVTPFYRREQRTDCRGCHMPRIRSQQDRAAKEGRIASHRWLGANTAAPMFYGQEEQTQSTIEFLRTDVLEVDIFAIRRESSGEIMAALDARDPQFRPSPDEELTVEVVVSNRNAAHSFPPEVRDLYEAWVEFEALDSNGRTVFHSGAVAPDGLLDERAHVYKQIILDEQGKPITRHQIWLTNIKAYDNAIPPGKSDVVRFRFRTPAGSPQSLTLRAAVNYRRLNQEYTGYVLARQKRQLTLPVVTMSSASLRLAGADERTETQNSSADGTPLWRRWNDYGVGLLEQSQYGPAAAAFKRAARFNPSDSNLLVNRAIAEMRTERFGLDREQWRIAGRLLDEALTLAPDNARARFYRAIVWRGEGQGRKAAEELTSLAAAYPRDREVSRQLAQTFFSLGAMPSARTAIETLLRIDPTDAGGYQMLSPILEALGQAKAGRDAYARYLEWREDPMAAQIAGRFYAGHPQWADERNSAHIHSHDSAARPVLTGAQAAPVE